MQDFYRMKTFLLIVASLIVFPVALYGFPGSGEGTPGDPYLITDWHELDAIRNDLNASYRLVNDLNQSSVGYSDLAGPTANGGSGWDPIARFTAYFHGELDGQGHTISDLYIDLTGTQEIGLFGKTGSGSNIYDLNLENFNISGGEIVGGLAGEIHGTVNNLHLSGELTALDWFSGGMAGINEGTITNSSAAVTVEGDGRTGGLVGRNLGLIELASSSGAVSGQARTGGLVGWNNGEILRSHATGEVDGTIDVGGLVGRNNDDIRNSYATGQVTGNNDVGGLVGHNRELVSTSYSVGRVPNGGGLVGNDLRNVNRSFWDVETSETTNSDGGTGKTTDEMKDIDTFLGLNWDIEPTGVMRNDGYPFHLDNSSIWVIPDPDLMVELTIDIIGEGTVLVDGTPYSQTMVLTENDTVLLEAEPEDFWHFEQWGAALSGSDTTVELLLDEDKTVTAEFDRPSYTVTVDQLGSGQVLVDGTPYSDPLTVPAGDVLDIEAQPELYWEFVEWSGDLTGTDPQQQLLVDEDKQLTAEFDEQSFLLFIDIMGNGQVKVDGQPYTDPIEVPGGTELELEAVPDQYHYLDEWAGDLAGNDTVQQILVESNKNIIARFERQIHILTIDIVGQGEVLVDNIPYSDSLPIAAGETVELQALAADYWEFIDWSGDLVGTDPQVELLISDDRDITVTFEQQTYRLSAALIGEGELLVNGTPYQQPVDLPAGETAQLEIVETGIWLFDSWGGHLSGSDLFKEVFIDSDLNITAIFEEQDFYQLTINIQGEGEVLVDGETYTEPVDIIENQTVTLTAVSDYYWYFAEWSGDLSGSNSPQDFVMDSPKNITAIFSQHDTYILTVDLHGQGTVLVDGETYTEPIVAIENQVIQLTAVPQQYWDFVEWQGSLSGHDTGRSLLMNSDRSVTAVFEQQHFILQVERMGKGDVLIDGDTYHTMVALPAGETYTLEARPAEFWFFEQWGIDLSGTAKTQQLFVDQDRLVLAEFGDFDTSVLTVNIIGDGEVLVDGQPYQEQRTFITGTTITLEADPAEFWYFDSWEEDISSTDKLVQVDMDMDRLIEATFLQHDTNILTVAVAGRGAVLVDGETYTETVTLIRGEQVTLQAVPEDFWYLESWTGDITATLPELILPVDQDRQIMAIFAKHDTHILTVDVAGEGDVLVNGELYVGPLPVVKDDLVTVEAVPADNWTFADWSGDISQEGKLTGFKMIDDLTVQANFVRQKFTLTVEINGEGAVKVDGRSYTEPVSFEYRDIVELEAVPDKFWEFENWNNKSTKTDTRLPVLISSDRVVTANFSELNRYLLNFDIIGDGELFVNNKLYTSPLTLVEQDTVVIQPVPDDLWKFSSWGGDLQGTDTALVIVPTAHIFATAEFEKLPVHKLTLSIVSSGGVRIGSQIFSQSLQTIELLAGETVTLEAVKTDLWDFRRWHGDLVSRDFEHQLYIDSDKNITAEFARGSPGLQNFRMGPNPFRPGDGKSSTGDAGIWFFFDAAEGFGPFEISVYTVAGRLVYETVTTDPRYLWDTRNSSGDHVASGYYIYSVKERVTGEQKSGRLSIVRHN